MLRNFFFFFGRNVLLNFEQCKGPWHKKKKKRIINKVNILGTLVKREEKKKKKNLDKVPVILPKKRNSREASFVVIQPRAPQIKHTQKPKKKFNPQTQQPFPNSLVE